MVASADKTVTMYDAKGNPIQYAAKERPVSGYMTIYKNVAPYESESIFIYDGGHDHQPRGDADCGSQGVEGHG